MSKLKAPVGLVVISAAVIALVAVHLMDPGRALGNISYLLASCGAPVVAAVHLRRSGSKDRAAVLVTAGLAASGAGDLVWEAYQHLTGTGPDVSIADLFWLASYVLVAAAIGVLLMRSHHLLRKDADSIIDMSVGAVLVWLFVWLVWVAPTLADHSVSWPVRLVSATYPVLDAALLGMMARMLTRRTMRGPAVPLLAAGVAMWLASDVGSISGWTISEPLLQAGWMVGSVLMAVAVCTLDGVDEERITKQRTSVIQRRVSRRRVVASVAPMAVPWLVAIWAFARGQSINPVPLAIATAALGGLVVARMFHLLDLQRETQELYRSTAMNSSDATLIVSGEGILLHDAPGLAVILGDDLAGTAGTRLTDLAERVLGPDALPTDLIDRVLERPGAVVEREVPILDRPDLAADAGDDQKWIGLRVVNLLETPHVNALLVNIHDVTDRKRVERALEHQAFHDALTGLPNRALFADRLRHAFERRSRSGRDPALLFIDVDGFKAVNDRFGHEAGDAALRTVAERLSTTVRSGDTIARLGGDEFAVLVEHSRNPLADAHSVARRAMDALSAPLTIDGHEVVVGASIGIAPGDESSTPDSLLRDADTAMYHAKAAGRSRAVVYSAEMREHDDVRTRIEADLPGALAAGQFRLEYQPVVELTDGSVTGFEALLRWAHPEMGELAPDDFVPVAERSGIICEIGEWVLDAACAQLAVWHRRFGRDLSMAVNLSARQLDDPGLPDKVLEALRVNGLTAQSLVVEITETTLISHPERARNVLERLRRIGVRVAIDDFGTGYSSLSYLQQLPVDILKIDRAFTSVIDDGTGLPDLVRGILDLARTLNLQTIAEGIETESQATLLAQNNCDDGQGFLWARPLAPESAEQLLRDGLPGPTLDAWRTPRDPEQCESEASFS